MDFNKESVCKQLLEEILPFWYKQMDHTRGGFYGLVDSNLKADETADKSAVLMTRYLWAFSAVYSVNKKNEILIAARHAFHFIKDYLIDNQNDGLFWTVTCDGKVVNARKHIYAQSFAIYSLSEYYKVTQDSDSLDLAINLYKLIEEKAYDLEFNGYHEEFTIDWIPDKSTLLGAKGEYKYYSTNATLHLLEAYTNLYQVYPDSDLRNRLHNLMNIFKEYIITSKGHCRTIFTEKWEPINEDISYAHDIETAWLIQKTLKVLNTESSSEYYQLINKVVESVVEEGLDSNGIILDKFYNEKKTVTKQWWSLAESIIGFQDAFERTQNKKYKQLAVLHWEFVQRYIIDSPKTGEWLPNVDEEGRIVTSKPTNISDGWKGPYHTVRMYIELLHRL